MKTLANCSPREFLAQTYRIRKAAAGWMERAGMDGLRARLREIEGREEQIRAAARALMDVALETCPDETAELLGLMCFIEPEDLERHAMAELLGAAREIANCPEIIDFFISLARLESGSTPGAAGE